MASSTTMPMAKTNPNRVRLFRLKPMAAMTAKVPMIGHRHRCQRDHVKHQFWRNNNTTMATRIMASPSVSKTPWIDSRINGVVS